MSNRMRGGWSVLLVLLSAALALADAPAPPPPPEKAGTDTTAPLVSGTVTSGSKSFTENIILGDVLRHLAASQHADADHRAELGGTQILWKALVAGELDAYPEYTGTLLQEVLKGEQIRSLPDLHAALARQGVRMTGRLGFNNTYALGMRADVAERLGIRTISDLAKHPQVGDFEFGLSDEFMERSDGWTGLAHYYGLPDNRIRLIDHALAYRAIASGAIEVMDLYSTDAEIKTFGLRALVDDRRYFSKYSAIVLYRADLAERAPKVAEAFHRLEGTLPNERMIGLNERALVDRVPETNVAADFIREELGVSVSMPPEVSPWRRIWRRFLQTTGEHLLLVAISLAAAICVAVPLGVAAYRMPTMGQSLLSLVGMIQTIPSMAVLVFIVPLLGLGPGPAIVALFLYSLLPIVRGTYTGLHEIPVQMHESAEVLGLPAWTKLWQIELPLASPSILSGIKTAAVINVGTATIGALIGAGGYGQPILSGIRLNDISLILQGAVPAALLAIAVQYGFDLVERFVVPAGLRVGKA